MFFKAAEVEPDVKDLQKHSDIISDVLEEIIISTDAILKQSIIEFLTINFYKYLIDDLSILFKFQIYLFLIGEKMTINAKSKKAILSNIEVIEYNTKRLILDVNFKRYFIHHYRYILNREIELFQRTILADVEKRLHKQIDSMNGVKEIIVDHAEKEYDDNAYYPYSSCLFDCMNSNRMCRVSTAIYCPQLLYAKPKQGKSRSFWGSAKIEGSFVNKLLKSMTGIFFSFFLVILLYFFMRYVQNTSVYIGVTIICVLGAIIIFGLAFNSTIRAYILLMGPFFATLTGRLIISYFALKWSRKHIYGNYEENWNKLKFTFTCMKKVIYDQIDKMSKLDGMIGFIFKAIKLIIRFCELAAEGIRAIKNFLSEIFGFIKEAFELLKLILSVCSSSFGKPMFTCFDMVEAWEEKKCGSEIKGFIDFVCVAAFYVIRLFCLLLLLLQLFCFIIKLLFKALIYIFKLAISALWNAIFGNMFGRFEDVFDIHFNASRTYHYYESQDKSFISIVKSIGEDYKMKILYLITVIREIDYFFPFFIIYLLYESWSYLHKYKNHIEFDNYTLSANFEKIDKKRYIRNYRTLLPLRSDLKKNYVCLGSTLKTKKEEKQTTWAIRLFFVVLLPILYMIAMDQLMIVVYSFVIKHAYVKTNFKNLVPGNTKLSLHIEGVGFMSKIYKFLFNTFGNLARSNITIDTTECCPPVSPMKENWYIIIGTMLAVLLFVSVFNSYILRLRGVFIGSVYTQRDEERAIWLYNHIIVHDRKFFFSALGAIRERTYTRENLLVVIIKKLCYFVVDLITTIWNTICRILLACCGCISCLPCWSSCCLPIFYCITIIYNHWPPICLSPTFYAKNIKKLIMYLQVKLNPISCEFCAKSNLGLEFQTCLNDSCQKVFCFECYSRFYNECPFCILRSKNNEDDVESIEADSSDEELQNHFKNKDKGYMHTRGDKDVDDDDDEEKKLLAEKETNNKAGKKMIEDGKNGTDKIKKLFNENKAESFVKSAYGNKQIYIKILNKVQEKKFQRSILTPKRDRINDVIEAKTESILQLLKSDKKYAYTIKNFKTIILAKKEIHDLFNNYSFDIYNEVCDSVFENIVNDMQLDEYFVIDNEIKKEHVFEYLKKIHKSMKIEKKVEIK